MPVRNKKNRSRKWIKVALLVLISIVAVVAILEITDVTHLFYKEPVVNQPSAPINKLPSKPIANDGDKQISDTSGVNKQTSTDKNGQAPGASASDPSKWQVSTTGKITVKLPTSGSTFKSGNDLYGASTNAKVQYRLIDNQVGVISQGVISVVGGNFTAGINFKSYSSSGRLDVFSTDDNGREFDEVQIPVNF